MKAAAQFKHSLLTGCLIEVEQQPYLMEPCGSEHILDLTVLPQRSDRQVSDLQLDIRRMLCKGQLWHKKQTCTTQVKVNSLINNNFLFFFWWVSDMQSECLDLVNITVKIHAKIDIIHLFQECSAENNLWQIFVYAWTFQPIKADRLKCLNFFPLCNSWEFQMIKSRKIAEKSLWLQDIRIANI